MTWTTLDTWIVATGMVTAAACALVGNFLVIRRMSLMGDAISHAVLPGIAAGFLLSGTRHPLPVFAGAVMAGLCTAFFTEWIHRKGRVEESSAMGVVFTSLFALGLVMIVRAADTVDLDPGCVLYGSIELSPLDTVAVAGLTMPRAFATGLFVLLLNAVVIGLFYKEFKITSFDPELATALGIPARRMYYLLMTLVAVTTVASFETVGSILVIAMLIVPAAAASIASVRLGRVILWSLVFAAVSAAAGHVAAITVPGWFGFIDTSTSGAMAVAAGGVFTGVLLFAPEQGLLARIRHQRALKIRVEVEDTLGQLHRWHEEYPAPGGAPGMVELAGRMAGSHVDTPRLVARLRRLRLVKPGGTDRIELTEEGRERAASVVRDHRLWERYLVDKMKLPADHVHATSEQLEHVTDPGLRRELRKAAAGADVDPHGKRIPD